MTLADHRDEVCQQIAAVFQVPVRMLRGHTTHFTHLDVSAFYKRCEDETNRFADEQMRILFRRLFRRSKGYRRHVRRVKSSCH